MDRPQDNLIMGIRFVGYAARNRTLIACPIIVKDTWASEKPFQFFLYTALISLLEDIKFRKSLQSSLTQCYKAVSFTKKHFEYYVTK